MDKSTAIKKYESAMAAKKEYMAEAERKGLMVLTTASGGVASIGMGMAESYFGERAILGMNIPAVVGITSGLVALSGVGGEYVESVALGVGNAGINIEGYKFGSRVMDDYRASRSSSGSGSGTSERRAA